MAPRTGLVDVFVYARMDSGRLPGKALKNMGGMSLIERVMHRAQLVHQSRCVLLTTRRSIDNPLSEVAEASGIEVIRGNTNNLVRRTTSAIMELNTNSFVRVNGDSPLFEPRLVNYALETVGSAGLISNLPLRQFPYGVSVEIVSAELYLEASHLATPADVEHVTRHLYREGSANKLLLGQSSSDGDLSLTIDTEDDYLNLAKLTSRHSYDAPYWEIFERNKPVLFWVNQ